MEYDHQTRALALEAYDRGTWYETIAAIWGPSRRTVQMWARATGRPQRRKSNLLARSNADRAWAVDQCVNGGWSTRDVGEMIGVDGRTVAGWVRAAGHRRTARPPLACTLEQAREAMAKWRRIGMAASVLSVSPATVRRRLRGG